MVNPTLSKVITQAPAYPRKFNGPHSLPVSLWMDTVLISKLVPKASEVPPKIVAILGRRSQMRLDKGSPCPGTTSLGTIIASLFQRIGSLSYRVKSYLFVTNSPDGTLIVRLDLSSGQTLAIIRASPLLTLATNRAFVLSGTVGGTRMNKSEHLRSVGKFLARVMTKARTLNVVLVLVPAEASANTFAFPGNHQDLKVLTKSPVVTRNVQSLMDSIVWLDPYVIPHYDLRDRDSLSVAQITLSSRKAPIDKVPVLQVQHQSDDSYNPGQWPTLLQVYCTLTVDKGPSMIVMTRGTQRFRSPAMIPARLACSVGLGACVLPLIRWFGLDLQILCKLDCLLHILALMPGHCHVHIGKPTDILFNLSLSLLGNILDTSKLVAEIVDYSHHILVPLTLRFSTSHLNLRDSPPRNSTYQSSFIPSASHGMQ
ncbi:hypothetical protein Tco_0591921 [Tanacetum coccineum]